MPVTEIVDKAVLAVGFFSWLLFLPQIKLLLKVKQSDSLSTVTVWGSFGIQRLILLQSALKENWELAFVMLINMICLAIVLVLIYRYKNKRPAQ